VQLHVPDAPPAAAADVQSDVPDGAAGPAGSREIVVFVLGGGDYGLPIADVREIVRYTPPRPLPGMRAGVLGLVQVHGRLLDVVDVRGTLGLEAVGVPHELVVVEHGDRTVAMPVEAIRQVVSVGPAALREPPDASAEVEVVAALEDRLVLVLRAEAVVGPAA
jgi:purine-binding chemotaxis protein CheW